MNERYQLIHDDCLNAMKAMSNNSIDSIITDPPYGLSKEPDIIALLRYWLDGGNYQHNSKGFMGKAWDNLVPHPDRWRECYRVLKPGGYLLTFASSRAFDLMAVALRMAGFEQHPFFAWIFGSGFCKATNLSKMIDKMAGAEREVVGHNSRQKGWFTHQDGHAITAPATDAAKQWDGWYYGKQSLKPAMEPILMFQKPPERGLNMTQNVLKWGTGAVNIDDCRVKSVVNKEPNVRKQKTIKGGINQANTWEKRGTGNGWAGDKGRWAANVIHDGSDCVKECFPETGGAHGGKGSYKQHICAGNGKETEQDITRDTVGNASRYFYCAEPDTPRRFIYQPKASTRDRNGGCEYLGAKTAMELTGRKEGSKGLSGSVEHGNSTNPYANGGSVLPRQNHHPTVKPTKLMQYLCRLITPPNGVILDPFAGSGSTGRAAMMEGFRFVGIELDAEYIAIAKARVGHAAKQNAAAGNAGNADNAADNAKQMDLF